MTEASQIAEVPGHAALAAVSQMTDSVFTGLWSVVGEAAPGRLENTGWVEQPVVSAAGGEGEDALAGTGRYAVGAVAAVLFERAGL
jgi:hypothetical protein